MTCKKLKEKRISEGYIVSVIAKEIGMSQSNYYKKEVGKVKFTLEEAHKVAEFFGTTIDELFFGNEIA